MILKEMLNKFLSNSYTQNTQSPLDGKKIGG